MPRVIVFLAGDSYPEDKPIEDALRPVLEAKDSRFISHDELHQGLAGPFPIQTRLDMLERLVRDIGDHHDIFLVGRSSGARTVSLFAGRNPRILAVAGICYPFRMPGQWIEPERFAHLAVLTTPTLLIQGAGDAYGGIELTENYQLSEAIRLRFVPGGHEQPPATPGGRYIVRQLPDFIGGGWRDAGGNLSNFDEDFYFTAHPGLVEAKAKGLCQSGLQHFQACGRREGRKYRVRIENIE
jgi:pimeloyl-ACP methyl ester carboxylesterase